MKKKVSNEPKVSAKQNGSKKVVNEDEIITVTFPKDYKSTYESGEDFCKMGDVIHDIKTELIDETVDMLDFGNYTSDFVRDRLFIEDCINDTVETVRKLSKETVSTFSPEARDIIGNLMFELGRARLFNASSMTDALNMMYHHADELEESIRSEYDEPIENRVAEHFERTKKIYE